MRFKNLLRALGALALMLFASHAVVAQGVTTSSMQGVITDTSGEPLIGANVLAVHTPSGTTYGNSTDQNGFYRIPNMRVGGPYKITISYTGYENNVRDNIYLRLGQTYQLDIEMREIALELEGVEIVAQRNNIFDGKRRSENRSRADDREHSHDYSFYRRLRAFQPAGQYLGRLRWFCFHCRAEQPLQHYLR